MAPFEIFRGGADKMYPEYRHRMPAPASPAPKICERKCNCYSFLTCL
ncbi:MAG TPA: hypothetical protein VMU03_13525 [Gammaproteobacteria bacterium]|nr:hypothetical protein [Gammaproteobacteria bacterium]